MKKVLKTIGFFAIAMAFSVATVNANVPAQTGCWTDIYGGHSTPQSQECTYCHFHNGCKVGDTRAIPQD